MRKPNSIVTCGIVLVVGGCGLGGLFLGIVGSTVAARGKNVKTDAGRAKAMGMRTSIADFERKVPADQDARVVIDKLNKDLDAVWENVVEYDEPLYRHVLVSSAYPSIDFPSHMNALNFVPTALIKAAELKAVSHPKVKLENYVDTDDEIDSDLFTIAGVESVFLANSDRHDDAQKLLESLRKLNEMFNDAGTESHMVIGITTTISILRASERCAEISPDKATALKYLKIAKAASDFMLNVRARASGFAAVDAALIDTNSNKIFDKLPATFSIKDAYRGAVMSFWLRHYEDFPERLTDATALNKALIKMSEELKDDLILRNANLTKRWMYLQYAPLLARANLIDAEIQVLNGEPITAKDPFSDKPLKTIERNGHKIIYSFGPDRKDDKGTMRDYSGRTNKRFDLLAFLPPWASLER